MKIHRFIQDGFITCLLVAIIPFISQPSSNAVEERMPLLIRGFDRDRSSTEDVIYFLYNDVLRGKVLNESLAITTANKAYKDKFSRIFVDNGQRQIMGSSGSLQPVQGESDGALTTSAIAIGEIMVNSVGMKLKQIPAGTFTMGSKENSNEKPVHEVEISKAFYIGIYEVAQAEYKAVMGNNPSNFNGTNAPVENVNWIDANNFCRKLEEKERAAGKLPKGYEYRLPTEAEWEYARRAGSKGKYCFGDDVMQLPKYGWFTNNSDSKTHPVGLKKPNAWGLYDMHGNVWEWCKDWYGDYAAGKAKDPLNSSLGSGRVGRGGSWDDWASRCRSAYRNGNSPGYRNIAIGFRVVLAPSQY